MRTCDSTARTTNGMREGSAIFTVLGVIFMMSMLLGIVMKASSHRVFTARKLADRVKSVAYAEAGIDHAYSILATNFSLRTNSTLFPQTTFEDGSYYVQVVMVSNDTAILVSTGYCGSVQSKVVVDLKNYGGNGVGSEEARWWESEVFDYAIVCGGEFKFCGGGYLDSTGGVTRLHSNSGVIISGNAGADIDITSSTSIEIKNNNLVDGNVTAPVLDIGNTPPTGDQTVADVPQITIPRIDFTPWANQAQADGTYFVGEGWTPPSDPYTVPGDGILFIEGSFGPFNGTINGQIFATGDIKITGGDINASGGFAMASRDGDISNQSQGDITGLIYAYTGSYKHTSGGHTYGQIVIGGAIEKGGGSDITVGTLTVPVPPGGYPGTDGTPSEELIGVSAWQQ